MFATIIIELRASAWALGSHEWTPYVVESLTRKAFVVKLHIYNVHLWLSKTHVEATTFDFLHLAEKIGRFEIWLF